MNALPAGHRAPALWLLLPLLAGLTLGRAFGAPLPAGLLLVAGAICLALAAGWPRSWVVTLPFAVLCASLVLHQLARNRLTDWDSLPPREAELEIVVTRIFGPSIDGRRINGLGRIAGAEPHLADIAGQRIYFSLRPAVTESPRRGSRLAARGVLEVSPGDVSPGSFEHYLDATGVNFKLRRGTILRETAPPSAYRHFTAAVYDRFHVILSQGLGDKDRLGGIYRAMLLGQTSELTDEQDDLFLRSGTLHLFAISGLHIATIAAALYVVLSLLPVPRWMRFLLGTTLLWLYTDVTGAAPSAVRAFIMATLISALPVLRLPGNTAAALAVSAVVALTIDPLQAFGAGFQMSYGIVAALLFLGLPLSSRWLLRPTPHDAIPRGARTWLQRVRLHTRQAVITSVCLGLAATVISTVTGITFFQLLTPGAFIANLVLIPIASLVVIAGCASLLCGFVGLAGASIVFNHAAALLLWMIESAVRLVVWLPGASMEANFRLPWLGPASLLFLLALMLQGYACRWSRKTGGFWPPFAALALILLFGVRYGS